MIQDDNKKAELFNDYFFASLKSLGFNRSGPIALDVSSIFNISSTSFSVIVMCSRPLINKYRPISFTIILAKVLERLVYRHIYNYLIDNNLITSHQSGFTPGDSAVNQLLYITKEFGRALDDGKEVRVVFCDISKAFDRVWHNGLLRSLQYLGKYNSEGNWSVFFQITETNFFKNGGHISIFPF
jgi:hypothetical protein